MAAQLGTRLTGVLPIAVVAALLVFTCTHGPVPAGADNPPPAAKSAQPSTEEEDSDGAEIDPLGPNAACYVCHIPFVREKLSKVHLKEKIGCIQCHGRSAGHANDEDIGATKPDVYFKRHQVDAACRECHKEHDVPARQVIARWIERGHPPAPAICTDCHGAHRIEQSAQDADKPGQPVSQKDS